MRGFFHTHLRKISSDLVGDLETLIDLPETRQAREWSCGAAATQAVFGYYGLDLPEQDLVEDLKTTAKWGTELKDIVRVAKDNGFKVDAKQMNEEELKSYLDRKIPVIIEVQAWSDKKDPDYGKINSDPHLVVAVGFSNKHFVFRDPWKFEKTYLTYDELDNRWHCWDRTKKKLLTKYGIAIYGKPIKYDKKHIKPME